MEKENDILSSLFQQARNEEVKTSHHEVGSWIGYFSILALLGAGLAKLKILFTKSYLMYTAILLSTSIGIGTYFFLGNNQENQSVSTLPTIQQVEIDAPIIDNSIDFSLENEVLENNPSKDENVIDHQYVNVEQNIEQGTLISSDLLGENELEVMADEVSTPAKNTYKDYGAFSKLVVSDIVRVVLVQNGTQGVRFAEGTDESMLKITNKSGKLIIETSSVRVKNTELKVYVSFTDLSSISAGDASRISTESTTLKLNNVEIMCSDAGRIDLGLTANKVNIASSDAARITLNGKANDFDVVSSDASRINAFDLLCQHVKILCSDASRIQVNTAKSLKIKASDATSIEYKGNPESVDKEANMPSKVTKVE